jgi:hypothetical protein
LRFVIVTGATDRDHGRCTPHPPKLSVADDIVSMRLGKGRRRGRSIALACSKIGCGVD